MPHPNAPLHALIIHQIKHVKFNSQRQFDEELVDELNLSQKLKPFFLIYNERAAYLHLKCKYCKKVDVRFARHEEQDNGYPLFYY